MHPYYQQNKEKFRKQMDVFLSPIAEELESDTGQPYRQLLNKAWTCYETQMLEELPFIGGDRSSGTRNLTGAFAFVALGEILRPYGVSLERWGYLTTLAYRRYFEKIPRPVRKLPGLLVRFPGLANRILRKKDASNAANAARNPGAFETSVQTPTEEFPIIYHTKVCPLADFARAHGYLDYMPYICNLDYVSFGVFGIPFYREKTCAAGDGVCDFKFTRSAPVVPSWPCHALTEGDPLK